MNAAVKSIQLKILDQAMYQTFGLPHYATEGSAGLDLRACIESTLQIKAGEVLLIPTGLSMYIEDPSMAAVILPRSGLGHKNGIVLGNLVGLIDSDYQGELKISCWNRGVDHYTLQRGDRIAQLVIVPVIKVQFQVTDEFDLSGRGEGGFGHSGRE